MPRPPDPELEQRILAAASRLWARGGEKALTMRAIAKAAGTTTPTVYERYRDRGDILKGLRLQTRSELFAALSRTRTLRQAVRRHIEFALEHRYAYEVLFDGVAKPPSLHEPWPTFNLIRERVTQRLGGSPRQHARVMLALWCLMHGTAILIIRGRFGGEIRVRAIPACLAGCDASLAGSKRPGGFKNTGPKWPADLILGEGKQSRVENEKAGREVKLKAGRASG